MKQKFMVVYEHLEHNYSGFSPDIPGAGSVGDDLNEMRAMMKECLELYLSAIAEDGEPMPLPVTTSFDFGEIRVESVDHYVVEWLEVEVPEVQLATR
ncbi:type II toxin-antitoxin system HicB family antitoxin [Occallatibacter riparius]|uniref:Type II toxin-antitoxin system HicB family antitoxin n=1 Tax=Occallatibacter riparius TaxID=1002689 RepID=A0A9J7BJQ8_9BACT|nr:type II toxin-antitoxin system HicB family antitoxin [Occallatibacter riparius]UWZ82903.1 type II toxin-antitoxin system HicB family antitoxin [Occallatibacter riparius]